MTATFGDRLRLARERLGLSASRLSQLAGFSRGYAAQIEKKGTHCRPTDAAARAFAEALGVSQDWLATGLGIGPTSSDVAASPHGSSPDPRAA